MNGWQELEVRIWAAGLDAEYALDRAVSRWSWVGDPWWFLRRIMTWPLRAPTLIFDPPTPVDRSGFTLTDLFKYRSDLRGAWDAAQRERLQRHCGDRNLDAAAEPFDPRWQLFGPGTFTLPTE
mgnify:CR=1 FL=1